MRTYLVGGAVRDELLGRPVKERDWVVVGATPAQMLDLGYTQVGKDFPVFLHPHTKEEYALARRERKQGHGYDGFTMQVGDDVSLEDDLLRRDLTVNAMALDEDRKLIDPYNGRADLDARLLRHVSEAFVEDPLRVLRVARFAARYAHLGFRVAPQTLALMSEIVTQGELAYLPAERIWVETEKSLGEADPQVYVSVLRDCGALAALMPEVEALFGIAQRPAHHPEIDCGVHTLLVMQQAARLGGGSLVNFAALTHDLGKALTPEAQLPSHRGHEQAGLAPIDALCTRLKVPNSYRQLALCACAEHLNAHNACELSGDALLKLLEAVGALRQTDRLDDFLLVCEADSRGRRGFEDQPYPQAAYLRRARDVAATVSTAQVQTDGLQGKAIGEALRAERIRRLNSLRDDLQGQGPGA